MTPREPEPHAALSPEALAAQWVAREFLGAIGEEDRRALYAWLSADVRNQSAYLAARGAVTDLDNAELAFQQAHRTQLARESRQRRVSTWRLAAVAATVAVIAAFVGPDIASMTSDYRSGTGEVRQIVLSDGTRVTLDTRSAIDVRYSARERTVALVRGRAWFEVSHDGARPFSVRVLDGEARDIGTSFAVSRADDEAQVTVCEGEVMVSANGQRVMLTAGRGAHWLEGQGPSGAVAVDTSETLGWRTGNIVVNRRTLDSVIEELNRYRHRPIVLLDRQAANRMVSGVVQTTNLDSGIASLAKAQGLKAISLPFATILY